MQQPSPWVIVAPAFNRWPSVCSLYTIIADAVPPPPRQVISARKGEFETGFDRGGQTREHAMLVKTAGVKHLVVLVNKMDDHTVKWSEQRSVPGQMVRAEVSPHSPVK